MRRMGYLEPVCKQRLGDGFLAPDSAAFTAKTRMSNRSNRGFGCALLLSLIKRSNGSQPRGSSSMPHGAKVPEGSRAARFGSPVRFDFRLLNLTWICAVSLSFEKTPALTPALSPRRGRHAVRLFTLCRSRLQSAPPCLLLQKLYYRPTRSYPPHAGDRFTLSWGKRAGVRASVPLIAFSGFLGVA